MSIGLTVTTPLVRSTWYTSVAEPELPLTSTVAAVVPPTTVIVKASFTKPVATMPSGRIEGSRMLAAAAHPPALAGSFQVAKLTPREGTAPTVPPKLTLPLVAETKSLTALVPLVSTVG